MSGTPPVFLVLLGQRPQAITIALDVLLPRYNYERIGILHTDPQASMIAAAYQQLHEALSQEFPDLTILDHPLLSPQQEPIIDIVDAHSAEAYFYALVMVLSAYRVQAAPIHLLVAGGRKAMSIYATLAAARVFGEYDRVWTVLSTPHLIASEAFRIPPGQRDAVQVVHLPLQPSRLLPGVLAGKDADDLIGLAASPRQRFLSDLSEREKEIVEVLRQQPYATNDELAAVLGKSAKTIENQFSSIYTKLAACFDVDVTTARKRQVLLDVLQGRV